MRQPRRLGIVEWVTIGYNKVGPQEEKPRQRTAETRERTQRRRVDERGRTMSEHTHNEHEKAREGRKHHETFAERDPLTAEEPDVLESSASDPEFPAMQEFEVDEGRPQSEHAQASRAHMGDHRHRGGHRALHRFRRRRRLDEPHPGREGAADRVRGANRPRGFRAEREPRGSLNRASTPPPPSAISCDGYITCAPKGKSDSFAILRHWRPMGIPMTVMQ